MEAGERTTTIDLDAERAAELETEVLEAYRRLPAGEHRGELFGCTLDDDGLGRGIEDRYRLRARYAASLDERFALVDAANDARPWTAR